MHIWVHVPREARRRGHQLLCQLSYFLNSFQYFKFLKIVCVCVCVCRTQAYMPGYMCRGQRTNVGVTCLLYYMGPRDHNQAVMVLAANTCWAISLALHSKSCICHTMMCTYMKHNNNSVLKHHYIFTLWGLYLHVRVLRWCRVCWLTSNKPNNWKAGVGGSGVQGQPEPLRPSFNNDNTL